MSSHGAVKFTQAEQGPFGKSLLAGHMPQLDSVRAIAVFAVIFAHFAGPVSGAAADCGIDAGAIGVRLFFVLSGFLITGILMKVRSDANELSLAGATSAIRRFYMRRILRIFPLYFFVLLIAWLSGLREVRDNLIWHVLYVSDFAGRTMGAASHFWSLCVEEQFYLVWPVLALFVPKRYLGAMLLSVILICSTASLWLPNELIARSVFSFSFLAIGCFLALCERAERSQLRTFAVFAAVLLAAWPLCVWGSETVRKNCHTVFGLGQGLLFAWVIGSAAIGFQGSWGRTLNSAPLRYLGRISYGLYVYHLFMPKIIRYALNEVGYDIHPVARSGLYVAATLAIAALSWHFFEKRFCDLKARFQ